MIDNDTREKETNSIELSTTTFVEYYNENIPESFPKATVESLNKFQSTYPSLFKEGDQWTIDRHRKKLMDWLSSYRE